MSATVPPNSLPRGPAATLATALATARGSVVTVPNAVTLAQGQSINAQVVSSGGGQLVLATSLGNLTVQSPVALPPGTAVLIQVQAAGPTPQVTLQYHHGSGAQGHQGSPTPPLAAAAPGTGAGATQAAQPGAPVVTQLTEGSVLPASVTRAIAQPGSQPGTATAARPTATLAGGQASAAASTTPAAPAQVGATATQPALPAGTNLSVRVLAVTPPGSVLPATPPLAPQPGTFVFSASVTGHQAGGGLVVSGPTAELVLQNTHSLPNGTRLLLEASNLRPPGAAEARAPLSFLGGRWDALNEALTSLQQTDPTVLRQVVETAIPNPGPRMTGTVLFFLSALFSGDVRRFVGADAMRQLGRGTGGISDRLSGEFNQLQRTATDASGQDWRVYHIPFLTEEGLEELRFLLRKGDDEGGGSGEADTGTRFMIEVNLSRLGPFQFDGLARNKHLDLVIRTQQDIPVAMRDDIREIYGNTISALGFSGTIALKTVERFDISPIDQVAENHKDLTV